MPSFSKRSLDNLAQCDERLQKVAKECIKTFDFTVIQGFRGEADQNKAFREGKSKLQWPASKHNRRPSHAFDATPVPLDWDDIKAFQAMGRAMKQAAHKVGVKITWGGDWKSFKDFPHFEI